jgi:dTDP-4-amino-4,6-dideoxygalactose transaminase
VLVDVQEATGNLDPDLLAAATTDKTRAILPVHLYGQPCDLDPILDYANGRDIPVIEDACQAHGARYRGRRVGSFGRLGCFSFYPGKNLGAYGEGGAVATDETALAERIRRLRDHGQSERYHHTEVGYNARMEGIQGAVLRVKLRRLDAWNVARRERTARYDARLAESGLQLPVVAPERDSVHHLYVVRSDSRDELRGHLTRRGVQTGIHYPVPVHIHQAYASLGHGPGAFPVAEAWAARCLSLPMYPELPMESIDRVAEEILAFEGNKTLTPLARA